MTQPTPIRRDDHRPRLLDLFSCAGGAGTGYEAVPPAYTQWIAAQFLTLERSAAA